MGSEKIQRKFWDQIYSKYAWLYDAVDWLTFNTTQKYRLSILPYLPEKGMRILELGVGSGKLQLKLAKKYQLSGLDLAWGMVQLTTMRLTKVNLTSYLCQANVCALPWSASTFDAAILSFVLSAIPDIEHAINEVLRVLKPKGKIIILDAGEADDNNLFAHFLARLWELFGDFIRDERKYMVAAGMKITRKEMGPGRCVHIVVGER
jgi:ubiquinone/menaquinone biosynthesis C-methylase UbiE